jgi:hypothetical protein
VANDCSLVTGTLAVTVCQPVEAVEVNGPASLPVGANGTYAGDYFPLTTTEPVTLTWSNGTVGSSAVYSWTITGTYPVAVTATNRCGGPVYGDMMVSVTACQPVEAVEVNGPALLPLGANGSYTATILPLTTSLPLTLTWSNGTVGPSAVYSWTVIGTHTVAVTATNECGEAYGEMVVSVTVCQPVEAVEVKGPGFLLTKHVAAYTATYFPPTATLPVNLLWDNGRTGPTAFYSWTDPGLQIITVSAANLCSPEVTGTLPVTVCQPVEAVELSGPASLPAGVNGTFTATSLPSTTTLPLSLAWSNGATGTTAIYSWAAGGTYTVAVTATSACGQVSTSTSVLVAELIYLPFVAKGWYWDQCSIGPDGYFEEEPNNYWNSANGSLCAGVEYQGRPEDGEDFYFFSCDTGVISVTMWNYVPEDGWLVLYDGPGDEYAIDSDNIPGDGWHVGAPCEGKQYWVRVLTLSGFSTVAYTLQVDFVEP